MDATALWALLLLACVVLLAMVGLAVLAERPRGPRLDPQAVLAEAEELSAHAIAVRAQAGRAAAVAVQTRAEAVAAGRYRDEAWSAQEASEQAYEQARQAALAGRKEARCGLEGLDRAGDGEEDGEAAVARAALAAYRRGDISMDELRRVWLGVDERDPEQEERERVAERCRIQLTAARRVYDQAAAAARQAEKRARVAEIAAQALAEEAVQAAVDAHEAMLVARRQGRGRRR